MNKHAVTQWTLFFIALLFTLNLSAQQAAAVKKGKALIKAMEQVNGGWKALRKRKNVQFTYVYKDFAKGTDISTERYIFDGEVSWGEYQQHQVNVFPKQKGLARQLYRNGIAETTLDSKDVADKQVLGMTHFLRKANFFWFTMMYKLSDPGVTPTFLGTEKVNGINYSKVAISYDNNVTKKKINDHFILYFNPSTKLVDFFYFSLPLIGVQKPVLKMELKYQKISGLYIATERTGVFPDAQGNYKVAGKYISKNILFNNSFKAEAFSL